MLIILINCDVNKKNPFKYCITDINEWLPDLVIIFIYTASTHSIVILVELLALYIGKCYQKIYLNNIP